MPCCCAGWSFIAQPATPAAAAQLASCSALLTSFSQLLQRLPPGKVSSSILQQAMQLLLLLPVAQAVPACHSVPLLQAAVKAGAASALSQPQQRLLLTNMLAPMGSATFTADHCLAMIECVLGTQQDMEVEWWDAYALQLQALLPSMSHEMVAVVASNLASLKRHQLLPPFFLRPSAGSSPSAPQHLPALASSIHSAALHAEWPQVVEAVEAAAELGLADAVPGLLIKLLDSTASRGADARCVLEPASYARILRTLNSMGTTRDWVSLLGLTPPSAAGATPQPASTQTTAPSQPDVQAKLLCTLRLIPLWGGGAGSNSCMNVKNTKKKLQGLVAPISIAPTRAIALLVAAAQHALQVAPVLVHGHYQPLAQATYEAVPSAGAVTCTCGEERSSAVPSRCTGKYVQNMFI